jgi:3-deoxy-manno-octulosonate cytidylyltransferase (CMP-KDO synthetase)
MKSVVIIPARWSSTRLPGKPLALIAGRTMLSRVVDIARAAIKGKLNVELVVATDDDRITTHAAEIGVSAVMTPVDCPTGTDRALAALKELKEDFDFIVNLQGDTPLTPPEHITALLSAAESIPSAEIVTPVVQLSWKELDILREQKKKTPFSGTTAIRLSDGRAVWFSKNIIPGIREEDSLRKRGELSPVFRHLGMYGYRKETLNKYVTLDQGYYEKLEGLEQLRALENGISIHTVLVSSEARPSMSGVDSPEDIMRAEVLIAQYGEIIKG